MFLIVTVSLFYGILGVLAALVFILLLAKSLLGIVVIGELQVGVVAKKFSRRNLAPGRLVALEPRQAQVLEDILAGMLIGHEHLVAAGALGSTPMAQSPAEN